jgi:hypothetical protein
MSVTPDNAQDRAACRHAVSRIINSETRHPAPRTADET